MLVCSSSLIFSPTVLQSVSTSLQRDEEEEDLNKAFDVQGFQQILCPPAHSPPDKHRIYDEQDFEGETLKSSIHPSMNVSVLFWSVAMFQ